VLGLSLTHLPQSEAGAILKRAIAGGVNYFEMGDDGAHELYKTLSRVLADEDRNKVRLAAGLPVFRLESPRAFDDYLERQLSCLDTDKLDFFSFDGLNRETWPRLKEAGALARAETAIKAGRLGHLGFAFHDDFQTLREILDARGDWDFVKLDFSFMDADGRPGVGGVRYAASRGLAVIADKPLKEGRLTRNLPEKVADLWGLHSPAAWALRWAWHHPETATAVAGVESVQQLEEYLTLADKAEANSLSVSEQVLIGNVRDAYRKLRPVPCTACRGCMPCPQGIDVPRIFEIYNDAVMFGNIDIAQDIYRREGHDIARCNACGACAAACGLRIPILDWLEKIKNALAGL
jgi:predicted aldo/keto reductase-like oxidoreductase